MNQIHSLYLFLLLNSHQRLGLPNDLFLSALPTKILYAFLITLMRASCLAHLVLPALITVPSFLLGSNILLSTPFSDTIYILPGE